MSEMGDDFRAWDAVKQAKRASNREDSAAMLTAAGIAFTSNNLGAHLIVSHAGQTYDFWPGTGLWQMRGDQRRHRGVRNLLQRLCKGGSKP